MKTVLGFLGCLLLLLSPVAQVQAAERVEAEDLYRPMKLKFFDVDRDLAQEKLGQAWDFEDGTSENFAYFSPEVKGLQVADGVIRFSTSGESVTLGWGNYQDRQPRDERIMLWQDWNIIELRVKQSAESSEWTLSLWQEGKATVGGRRRTSATSQLKGTDWQTLSFQVQMPGPDGFEIAIKGPADNVIEIDSLRVLKRLNQGYFRKEFALPPGKVWRAVAEVGKEMTVYVNGREVPCQTIIPTIYVTISLDLAPYLQPGKKNCIALLGQAQLPRDWACQGNLQGKVVMSGGEVILLDTDETWRASPTAGKGWNQVGFDDSKWAAAELVGKPLGVVVRKWPAYDGRLVLENPYHDPKLFFSDAHPLRVNVRVPEGLAKEQAELKWVLRRVGEIKEPEQEVASGTVPKFSRLPQKSSLLYQLDAGRQERGVYTLEVSLQTAGQIIESRLREPLMVVGKLPMKEVEGTSYEDGMELTLEDTIDFTNPKDQHLWAEIDVQKGVTSSQAGDAPRIVRKGNLVYRETAPGSNSMFDYQFSFQHPGSFYLMVVEYPDDAYRWMGVGVATADNPEMKNWHTQSGPGIITGYKYPLTNQMKELRFVHYADPGIQALHIVSLSRYQTAAAAKVRIYRIKDLPALKVNTSGERFLGLHTERARTLGIAYGTNDPTFIQLYYYSKLKLDMVDMFTQRLRWYLEGCQNYARYLRFTGQNLHVMGAWQYNEGNLSYISPDLIPSARIPKDIRDVALRVFEQNGISMMAMIEFMATRALVNKYTVSNAQVAEGADTIWPVSRQGKQAGGHAVSQSCFDHPAVQEAYLRVINDLAIKFSHSPAWKGIYVMSYPTFSGPITYAPAGGPLDYSYGDATIAAFEKDIGIRVPGDPKDPKRFQMRYLFLTSEPMRDKWIDWRCRAVHDLVVKTRDVLQKHRRDLQVLYGCYLDVDWILRWCQSGKPYLEFLRQYGWDPSLYRKDRDVWVGRYLYPNDRHWGAGDSYGYAAAWEQYFGKEPIAAYDREVDRFIVLNTTWHELYPWHHYPPPQGWPVPTYRARYVSQPNGDNSREHYTAGLIGADPEVVMYGFTDATLPSGNEQELREFARVLTALPKEKFQPVGNTCDFKHNLAIRDLRKGNAYWFYVANPGYWPIRGEVILRGTGRVVDPATGQPVKVRKENGKMILPIDLVPFAVAAFRVDSQTAKVESWSNQPLAAKHLQHMQGIMAEAERLLDSPARLAITLEDVKFMRETLKQARADLESGEYARAWLALTNWKFWTLLRQQLPQAEKFGAHLPGMKLVARDAEQIPELKVVKMAGHAPKIDGKLDDEIWQRAPATQGFLSMSTKLTYLGNPVIDTAVQAAYDRENLYLAFALADPDVTALRKVASPDHPEQVFRKYDDTLVMLLQPNSGLYQLAVNAGGIKYDTRIAGQDWFVDADKKFDQPWTAAVGQTDKVWMIEVAIPFSSLGAKLPAPGDRWRANFLRRFREFLVPECYWAPVRTGWYDTERYGYLDFV